MPYNSRDTPDADSPSTSSGSNASNSNSNGTGRALRNTNSLVHTNPNNFEGATSDIGAVLGLRHEKFKHKAASYESFLEKVSTYAISNIKDYGDLKPLFNFTPCDDGLYYYDINTVNKFMNKLILISYLLRLLIIIHRLHRVNTTTKKNQFIKHH